MSTDFLSDQSFCDARKKTIYQVHSIDSVQRLVLFIVKSNWLSNVLFSTYTQSNKPVRKS